MSSLYELDTALSDLLENGFTAECIDLETGVIDYEKASQFLETLPLERDKKIEAIALFIKNLEADAESIAAEVKNLKARQERKIAKADALRQYLQNSMLLFGQKTFETPKVALSFRKSSTVIIEDESKLNEMYIKTKIEHTPDKTAIKNAIKSGVIVEGAVLCEKQNLQIK